MANMGEPGNSAPLVPYDYSSEEETPLLKKELGEKSRNGASEEETPPMKKRRNGNSFGDKSCDMMERNLVDNINPELGKDLVECDSSPSETDKHSPWRRRPLIADGDECDYFPPTTDDELLHELAYWELVPRRAYDPKRREVYYVCVNNCERCNEYGCRELLKIIGCEKRFVCCSIERPRVFYAKLNEKEAVKLKGVKGIFIVEMYKWLLKDC